MKTTIGQKIDPHWNYDLEASLRIQQSLIARAQDPAWRFKGQLVTTGPYETLLGYASCRSRWDTYLALPVSHGLYRMVRAVNTSILRAMCQYPGFAELSEEATEPPFPAAHCGEAIAVLDALNGRKTVRKLNEFHARARVIRDVRLECSKQGIFFNAYVSFNRKPCESRWSVFTLLCGERHKWTRWNGRGRLAKWLAVCAERLTEIIEAE